jgi:hypothetical protein
VLDQRGRLLRAALGFAAFALRLMTVPSARSARGSTRGLASGGVARRDPRKAWAWFMQATRILTAADFERLVGRG